MKKFDHFCANLAVLERAHEENLENPLIVSGIIDKFFIQFELGWKVLKELLRYEGSGTARTGSPRAVLKEAFTVYDFIDERLWLCMLKDRNDMTHIYNGAAAAQLAGTIIEHYTPAFANMKTCILSKYGDELDFMN